MEEESLQIVVQYKEETTPESSETVVNILTQEGLDESLTGRTRFAAEQLTVLERARELNDFTGGQGDILMSYPPRPGESLNIYLGLGHRDSLNARSFQNVAAKLSKKIAKLNLQAVTLDLSQPSGLDPFTTIKPFLEGIAIGAYTFSKYFSDKSPFPLGKLTIVIPDYMDKVKTRIAIHDAAHNLMASNIARHLTNEASNHKTPNKFEQLIRTLLNQTHHRMYTLDYEELGKENLNLIRAVGQAGSDLPKLLIIEDIKPNRTFTLGIVGKAVTFDAGGLMIKSSADLPHMREDVAGAAAVVGAMSVLESLKLDYNIVAAIPIAENLIDSHSYRPADVCFTRRGLTVEINNTDAEGRLLLADAFLYMQDKYKLNAIMDVATLTGAITRALGNRMAGFFTNNEDLAELLTGAYSKSLEKFWRMPLEHAYSPMLKSNFADIRNDPGEPKAITAALFLECFIHHDLPWLHLDVGSIVNPSINDPLYGNYEFATGIPSLTLIEFFRMLNQHLERFPGHH